MFSGHHAWSQQERLQCHVSMEPCPHSGGTALPHQLIQQSAVNFVIAAAAGTVDRDPHQNGAAGDKFADDFAADDLKLIQFSGHGKTDFQLLAVE